MTVMNLKFIKRYIALIGAVWTLACIAALTSHLHDDYQKMVELVQARAGAMLDRDLLYLDWAESNGGVYVPATKSSPGNPHLESLAERDIETSDGLRLTLINPSYMIRLVYQWENPPGDTTSKLTRLKYLDHDTAPDPWETQALRKLAGGAESVSEVVEVDGNSHIRLMRPFPVEGTCRKCHDDPGWRPDRVGGGLSLSVPLHSFLADNWQHNRLTTGIFVMLWMAGLYSIVLLGRKLFDQTNKMLESERRRDYAEMSLNFLSNYDRLTSLPNRFKFEEQLDVAFEKIDDGGGCVVVTALEVRNYKQIIDNFDHPVGSKLFKMLAERVAALLPQEDSVARFGEDRLLFSYTFPAGQAFSQSLLNHLYDAASKPMILKDQEFFPQICMGSALYPNDATNAKQLVHKVVSALSSCLEQNHGGIKLYSQSLLENAKSRLEIESGLRRSLADNNFELYLQPQIDAIRGKLIGAEALIRWQMEDRGYVPPNEFIPVAEECGLILRLGEWVLQTACIKAVQLKKEFGRVIPLGVNVSATQFQDPEFIDIIDEALCIEGVEPAMLEIEITESTFIEDIDRTIELLTDLKIRGLNIAIDDFGTGYSSLSYLNKFPIDRLKIDRMFVADIADNQEDRILVSLIVDMGHKLGMNVIAEGVEDEIQKNLLIGMGCRSMQGFHFAKPLPFEDFCRRARELDRENRRKVTP